MIRKVIEWLFQPPTWERGERAARSFLEEGPTKQEIDLAWVSADRGTESDAFDRAWMEVLGPFVSEELRDL